MGFYSPVKVNPDGSNRDPSDIGDSDKAILSDIKNGRSTDLLGGDTDGNHDRVAILCQNSLGQPGGGGVDY